jgi:DNA-binding GntR family transcriptional regulator
MSLDFTAFEPRRGPVPLYKQVAAFIARGIKAGKLKPGDGLPGEQALADAMGVSYDTVRKALAVLREDGLIQTSTGIGSFVAAPPEP